MSWIIAGKFVKPTAALSKLTSLWIFPFVWDKVCWELSLKCELSEFLLELCGELQLSPLELAQPHWLRDIKSISHSLLCLCPFSGKEWREIFPSHTQKGKVLPALHNPAQNMAF